MSYSSTTPRLLIDVNDPTNLPLSESSRFAERVEELGFAGVGMPDHPYTGRDVFVRLALAARRTNRVTLFPAVTNPVSRGPKMLATLGATLGELAPGRARLVLSTGQASVRYVGKPRATVARIADSVEAIIRTLAVELAPTTHVPVYINSSSPRLLKTAGAVADGVYAMVGVDPEVQAEAISHVEAGVDEAGRETGGISVAFGLPVFMAESQERAYESAAEYAVFNLQNRNKVFSQVLLERIPALAEVHDVAGLPRAHLRHLVDAMVVAGTPQEAAAKVLFMAERAVTRHFIARVEYAGEDPFRAIETFSSALHAAGGESVLCPDD